jgi:hypothetical protein
MNEFVELRQAPDDSWTIEVPGEVVAQVIPIGKWSKFQAIREAQRRGYTRIRCWDKTVIAAITSGTARLDRSVFE